MIGDASPFVSVIIPVYNAQEHLPGLLTALRDQSYPASRREIIIVDNGSTDRSVEIIQSFGSAQCLIEDSVRSSYAARDKGIGAARGEVFAFTDADAVPRPDWLEKGIECMVRHNAPRVAGAAAPVFHDPENLCELYDSLAHLRQEHYARHGWGATVNLFVRREVFDRAGLFDGRLVSSGDREFGERAHRAGFEIRFCPEAVVRHHLRGSAREILGKARRIGKGLAQLWLLRHENPAHRLIGAALPLPLSIRFKGSGEFLRTLTLRQHIAMWGLDYVRHWALTCGFWSYVIRRR